LVAALGFLNKLRLSVRVDPRDLAMWVSKLSSRVMLWELRPKSCILIMRF